MAKFKRIFIDQTITQRMPMHRGVPRVVKSFIAAKDALAESTGAPVETVIFADSQWKQSFAPGDLLINLDSWWAMNHYEAVAEVRKTGAQVATVVYDLIPITHTELLSPAIRDAFATALSHMIQNSDFLMCISQTVENDLRKFILDQGIQNTPPITYFYLGSNFTSLATGNISNNPSLIEGEFALTVGAIEPRKGYAELLECLRVYWQKHPQLKLVIVGGWADRTEEVRETIHSVNAIQPNIIHFESVDDTQLEKLYQDAKYVICPSLVEGFGLPLIEAIARKKTVLANDTPIFREIGQSYPIYFAVKNPKSFEIAISTANTNEIRSNPLGTLISWTDAAHSFGKRLSFFN